MASSAGEWSDFHSRRDEIKELPQELDTWRQGDLLADLPMSWVVPAAQDPITGLKSGHAGAGFHQDSVIAKLAIVCSQTCDIAPAAVGLQHPFVLFAPLIAADDIAEKSIRGHALKGLVRYLFPIPLPKASPKSVVHFADLRILIPVSKGFLTSATRIPSVMSEDVSLRFAGAIGQKFRRPAHSDVLSYTLPKALSEMAKAQPSGSFDRIQEVRIAITGGSRLSPTAVDILVFSTTELTLKERGIWLTWVGANHTHFMTQGVNIGPVKFHNPDVMSAALYRKTTPLAIDGIGTDTYY